MLVKVEAYNSPCDSRSNVLRFQSIYHRPPCHFLISGCLITLEILKLYGSNFVDYEPFDYSVGVIAYFIIYFQIYQICAYSLNNVPRSECSYPEASEEDVRRYERSFRMLPPAHKVYYYAFIR